MNFKDFNLHEGILQAVEDSGFELPTPIQSQAIPEILRGSDLRASAQTGTGKTAAYILPTLNKLTVPAPVRVYGPRVLILVPTRELAIQVADEATKYSKHLSKVKTVCLYGGAPYPLQNKQLGRPYEILVATPGRLIDHMERNRVNLSFVEVLILDEADRMLDMGFIEPVEKIAAATPQHRQTLLFSATMKGSVLRLSNNLMNNPKEINVAHEHAKHENIEQRLYYADDMRHKQRLLTHFLDDPQITQAIIFTSTKLFADRLVTDLYEVGYEAAALHGDMNQRQRTRTISRMRDGSIRFLVATDVAARGIDVPSISHVINFDLPRNAEDYVHRIGRTGRASAKGIALSLAAASEKPLVIRIERFTGHQITTHVISGMEPSMRPARSGPRGPKQAPQRRRPAAAAGNKPKPPFRSFHSKRKAQG